MHEVVRRSWNDKGTVNLRMIKKPESMKGKQAKLQVCMDRSEPHWTKSASSSKRAIAFVHLHKTSARFCAKYCIRESALCLSMDVTS